MRVHRLLAGVSIAAVALAARAETPVFAACVGAGCEYAKAPPVACAAAATTPETHHVAFARGCLARRDFSRSAGRRDDPATDAVAPSRMTIDVVGSPEPEAWPLPTLEARFASALVQGNPEVAGGKIRHGAFYALGVYWGNDPLTFLYYNLRYGLAD